MDWGTMLWAAKCMTSSMGVLAKDIVDEFKVVEVAGAEDGLFVHRRPVAGTQVVQDDNPVAAFHQFLDRMTANISGSAGYKNHGTLLLSLR